MSSRPDPPPHGSWFHTSQEEKAEEVLEGSYTYASTESSNRASDVGNGRYPEWMSPSMCYLKGPAVGPVDEESELEEPELERRPVTNLESTQTPSSAEAVASSREHAERHPTTAPAAAEQQDPNIHNDDLLVQASLVTESRNPDNIPQAEIVDQDFFSRFFPKTAGGKWLCFGVLFLITLLGMTAIICGGGICQPSDPTPGSAGIETEPAFEKPLTDSPELPTGNPSLSPTISATSSRPTTGSLYSENRSGSPTTTDALVADDVEDLIFDARPTSTSSGPSTATISGSPPSETTQASVAPSTNSASPSQAPTFLRTPQPSTLDTTVAPSTTNPTPLASKLNPTTIEPSTANPTPNPSTLNPTVEPSTNNPTPNPRTLDPTVEPSTTNPTLWPTQASPLLQHNTSLHLEAQIRGETEGGAAGSSLALSGNGHVLLTGEPNAPSVSGDLERVGLVQVYERRQKAEVLDGDVAWEWTEKAIIWGNESMNQLGFSLASSYDGSIIVVSQPTADGRRGQVIIYEWQTTLNAGTEGSGEYRPKQVLEGNQTTDHFGLAVSLANQAGNRYPRLAIGSPYYSIPGESDSSLNGQVQVYQYSQARSEYEPMITGGGESFLLGSSSLDWFGWSVSLSDDGEVLAVGAPRNTESGGYVQCFRYDGFVWVAMGSPIRNMIDPIKLDDRWGHAISVSTTGTRIDGDLSPVIRLAIGTPWKDTDDNLNSGIVAVFEWSGVNSTWVLGMGGILEEEEPGLYHQFGYSVQMRGDAVAVGVPGWTNRRGLVNIYWWSHAFSDQLPSSGSTWEHLTSPLVGDAEGDDFGFSVGLSVPTNTSLSEKPSSLIVAAGAIMVSGTGGAGYSKVFQSGDSSS